MTAKTAPNKVVEAYGGVRWGPGSEAIALIVSHYSDCNEGEAFDALKTWVHQDRVHVRSTNGSGLVTLAMFLNLLPRPSDEAEERAFWLKSVEIDMNELRALLARPKPQSASVTAGRGRVSDTKLDRFLKDTATKQMTKPELLERTRANFPDSHVTEKAFKAAYKRLPAEQRREPGERTESVSASMK